MVRLLMVHTPDSANNANSASSNTAPTRSDLTEACIRRPRSAGLDRRAAQCVELQLDQLAGEIREALLTIVSDRSAHFASNLGVVELCIALHLVFDFSKDRLANHTITFAPYKSFDG